jgi:hypothetical protein
MSKENLPKRVLKRIQDHYKKPEPLTTDGHRMVESISHNSHHEAASDDANRSRSDNLERVLANPGYATATETHGRPVNPFEPEVLPSESTTSLEPNSAAPSDLNNPFSDAAAIQTSKGHDKRQRTQAPPAHPSQQPPPLHVIIVGGGCTGLLLAHSLHQAGIRYTLLERSPAVPNPDEAAAASASGTAALLWPSEARILDQLGLLGRTSGGLACPMRTRMTYHLAKDGSTARRPAPSKKGRYDAFACATVELGRPCMLVDRRALLRMLWESLPRGRETRGRAQTGCEVVSVETHASCVQVVCADGSIHEGSIVVGCDGARGVVRRSLCELRAEGKRRRTRFNLTRLLGSPGTSSSGSRTTEARYYGLVGSAPLPDGLEAGVCYETHGAATGATSQVFTSEDTA